MSEQPPTEPPEAGYTAMPNADGSVVLALKHPVQVGRELVSRVTIPRLTGKHMRAAQWDMSGAPNLGELMDWAAAVVLPRGVLDELDAVTARNVAAEVAMQLGKSRSIGAPASPP